MQPTLRPWRAAALSAVEPSAWGSLTLEFHPSLRRLAFSWNTAAVWKAMSQDETPPRPEMAPAADALAAVAPKSAELFSFDECGGVGGARCRRCAAATFAQICEDLGALLPQEEIPAAAASLLGTWADSGMIVKIGNSDGAA